jgi:hypothetical protein
VFKAFDVRSTVVEIDSNPGLTFYEIYRTERVPALTGLEPDPMANETKGFPGPGGTDIPADFISTQTPRGLQGAAGRHLRERLEGIVGQSFAAWAAISKGGGMHTTDTIDYGIVLRDEMTLELDDEPCLMAFVSLRSKHG